MITRSIRTSALSILPVFLILFAVPSFAQNAGFDKLTQATRVQRFGGEARDFMSLVHFTMTPEEPVAGEEVRIDLIVDPLIERRVDSGLIINADSILFIDAWGDWFPNVPLSTLLRDRTRASFTGRQNLSFTFQAPVTAGKHKIRIFFNDSGVPMLSFFGGNRLNANAGARMWIEEEFFIIENADATEIQKIPEPEYRWAPELQPFVKAGSDFCDAERRVDPSGGSVEGIGTFGGYEIRPKSVHGDDEVVLEFRLKRDINKSGMAQHIVIFGSWNADQPLAYPVRGAKIGELPPDDIVTVRFPAPREPKDYRVRLMITNGSEAPRSFFGGFMGKGREQDGPDLWTEFPLRVYPRLNMFNVAEEAKKMLIFDEMPSEKQVSQYGGGLEDWVFIESIELDPKLPAAGDSVQLTVKLRKGSSASSEAMSVKVFGSWNNGASLDAGISSAVKSLDPHPVISTVFVAPEEGGAQKIRVTASLQDAAKDFYGKGVTRNYKNLLFWSEKSFDVSGGAAPEELDAEKMLQEFLAMGIPVIEHQPVLQAAEGVDLRLFATIVTPKDIGDVTLHYRHENDADFTVMKAEALEERLDGRQTFGAKLSGIEHVYPSAFFYYLSVKYGETGQITLPFRSPEKNAIKTIVDKDDEAPIVVPLLPDASSQVKAPNLVVKFHVFENPQGIISGIDPNSIIMTLNGEPVFPEAEVLESRFGVPARMIFSLTKPGVEAKKGDYRVALSAKDLAGNVTDTVTWTFNYRSTIRPVGGWAVKGTQRTSYQFTDYGQVQSGEGTKLTTDQTVEVGRKLPWDFNFRSSGSFQQIMPSTKPRAERGTTSEKMTAGYFGIEAPWMTLYAGDWNAQMPSGLTSAGTVRGVAGSLKMGRFEYRMMWDPRKITTSSLNSANVAQRRLGAGMKFSIDPQNWFTYSRLRTKELPVLTSIGLVAPASGYMDFFELNLVPLRGQRQGWIQSKIEIGSSEEQGVSLDSFKVSLSGRHKSFNYRYEEASGDPNFGRMAGSSLRNDYAGRTLSTGWSMFQNKLGLSFNANRSHDNLFSQKAYATIAEGWGGSANLNIPKWPSLSYSYSLSHTLGDKLPRAVDSRNTSHSANLSYSRNPWSLTGSYSNSLSDDRVSFNVTRTSSWNSSLRYSPTPDFNLAYTWSPSRTYTGSSLNKTYNESRNLTSSYRFWEGQGNLNLGHSLSYSENSIFTSNTRNETLTGGLSITPRLQSRYKPTFNAQLSRTETFDRIAQTKTRSESFNVSLNSNF